MKTLRFPAGDPLQFLARLRTSEKHVAYATADGVTIVAWNPVRTVSRLQDIECERRLCIGYVGYDDGAAMIGVRTTAKDDLHLPSSRFHIYDGSIAIEGRVIRVLGDARFFESVRAILKRPFPAPSVIAPPRFRARMSKAAYAKAFKRVQEFIRDGEFYQLNLAQRFDAVSDADRRELFMLLARRNPAACMSLFEMDGAALLSLSPETFVRIDGRRIVTCPIKGTRPRAAAADQDAALREELLRSSKEQAELAMITDLLRNDVGMVSCVGTVCVEEERAVQSNPTVWHTYSVVSGKLERGMTPVNVLRKMLPGGSVTGCPKKRAVQEIDELEPLKRGPYTGVLCMFHGTFLRSSILIRTLVSKGRRLSLSVGGGIVADSKMADEYDETLAKARAFFDVAQSKTATWINGMPADPLDSKLALLDPLRARGVAVFETLRTYNGRLFELDAHCRRLRKSARLLGMRLPMPMGSIADALRAAAFCCGPGPLRIKVVATARDVILHVVPLVERPEIYRGVQAMFVHAERHTPRAKALPYDVSARAHARATRDGCEEALLLAPDGRVPEGAYSNLFWVKDGVLHTANNRVLLGITRGVVLRSARKQGIAVRYALALQNDLLHADEVFITKTTTGPIPIVRIGGSRIGTGKPGKTTMRIMQEFRRYYDSKLRRSSAIMRSC